MRAFRWRQSWLPPDEICYDGPVREGFKWLLIRSSTPAHFTSFILAGGGVPAPLFDWNLRHARRKVSVGREEGSPPADIRFIKKS